MPEDRAPTAQLDLALRAGRVRLPRDLWPMLPVEGEAAFDSADHLFDAWWGGTRVLAFVEEPAAVLIDEHGTDVSGRYPAVIASLSAVGDAGLVLDGELVGGPGPGVASGTTDGPVAGNAVAFVVEDLLVLGGRSLLAEPLQRRRIALAASVPPRDAVVVAEPVPCDGIELLGAAVSLGLPGIVAKRRDSPYLAGVRSALWLRIHAAAAASDATPSVTAGPVPGVSAPSAEAAAARFAPAPLRRALVLLRRLPLEEP